MDPPETQKKDVPDLRRSLSASPEKTSCRSESASHAHKKSSGAAPKRVSYTLGDPARPSDVNIFQSVDQHVAAVEELKEGCNCFILRSDFRFTYALVLKQEAGVLELMVTEEGGTKSIPKDHWRKYIRTLTSTSPKKHHSGAGHHEEGHRHREHHSKQNRKRNGRRVTIACESTVDSPPFTTTRSKRSVSKKFDPKHRSSMPEFDEEGHFERSQSIFTQERSPSSSDVSSSPSGVDISMRNESINAALEKFSFDTNYKSAKDMSLKKQSKGASSRPNRGLARSIPHIPTSEFKRSVSIQEDEHPKKSCKHGHHKRAQSECNQKQHSDQSPEFDDSSVSSLDVSSLVNSDDDSLLRAQVDLDKLLAKSMPSMKQSMMTSDQGLHGAFGDVTQIEILD